MPSFDVVSEVNMQEVRNALDQALREISTRFDFKQSDTRIELEGDHLTIASEDEFKVGQARDILHLRLAKRGVDIGALSAKPVEQAASGRSRQEITIRQGIDADAARRIVKVVKDSKIRVQASVQGTQVRITGKKRDDLQQVIALLRKEALGLPLQFVNFRD
ncbi:MAG: YajQ family cyclic di-GMP-binding protein [Acidiferrobacteraceae bacterium]